jgi:hypothetical protein
MYNASVRAASSFIIIPEILVGIQIFKEPMTFLESSNENDVNVSISYL